MTNQIDQNYTTQYYSAAEYFFYQGILDSETYLVCPDPINNGLSTDTANDCREAHSWGFELGKAMQVEELNAR